MTMNVYTVLIIGILTLSYLLQITADIINAHHMDTRLPDEFKGYYDEDTYRQSQKYNRETTQFGVIKQTVVFVATIVFIVTGGFNMADHIARSIGHGNIVTGLVFTGILLLLSGLLELPFSIYSTFIIEAKYGFNRTTPKTFILDILKICLLIVVIGCPVLAAILWFFEKTGQWAWVICWISITVFQILVMFVAPVIIMPLFNRFEPLEDGPLKKAIRDYADSQGFKMKGIFKMDGSKRSTKTNAFFTGFGKFRRIVLFDTLIDQHSVDELVSILAHEMGHYKMGHIAKNLILSFLSTGLMFFLMSLFINNREMFNAFKMDHTSIYAGLILFGFLYIPVDKLLAILGNMISRAHEYAADAYAVKTFKKPEAMITALKKLAVKNLADLSPHPFKVVLDYTHPPVLYRINAIRKLTDRA